MAIVSCILTIGLMLLLDHFILVRLGDWTMTTVKKFLMHDWTILDKNLIRWFPLVIGIVLIVKKKTNYKQFLKTFVWSIASLTIWITIGVFIALITWSRGTGYASLMPDYIKYQPYKYYWTVFILIGIMLPLLIQLIPRKKIVKTTELIDNKDVYNISNRCTTMNTN